MTSHIHTYSLCCLHLYLYIQGVIARYTYIAIRVFLIAVLSAISLESVANDPDVSPSSDVRLVIDISGSMKKNDPQNLRRPAIDMLVQLLPKGSKAGIWTFGQYVNKVAPHDMVSASWGKKALKASSRIQSNAQFTNIGEALEQAAYDAQKSSEHYQRHVILLTDGMVDIDRDQQRNQQERQRILKEILPMYAAAGITLHTIALSDNADNSLLNKLALKTDGKASIAKTADELMNVFLQVFDQAVPMEEAIFDGNSFVVDSSIEEFTALIFRQPNAKETEIMAPDGQTYHRQSKDPLLNWHHTDQYDMITFAQPLEGEWKVSADLEPQSRVTVVSDLSITVKTMPTNIALNERVETTLALKEESQTITRLEFLGLLDIDVAVSADNGKEWQQRLSKNLVPEDGLYPVSLDQFDQEGQYSITFIVDGKSFKRQYTHQLSVRKPFLVDVEKRAGNGKSQFIVKVTPQSNDINVVQTNIMGVLKDPSGNQQQLPFIITEDDAWMLMVATEKKGDYYLSITVQPNNGNADIALETIRLSQTSTGDDFVVADPVASTEPVAEAAPAKPTPVEIPEEEGMDTMSMILYGIIAVVNILIIIVGYIIYRKFFKKKADDEVSEESEETVAEESDDNGLSEPPMDAMAVEDLEDDDEPVDVEEPEAGDVEPEMDDISELEEDTQPPEETPDSEETPEEEMGELDLDDDDDVPDFSLDDFSPDSLDEEDLSGDIDESEQDK
jgi:uncharacterized protein (TIGR03503 family)